MEPRRNFYTLPGGFRFEMFASEDLAYNLDLINDKGEHQAQELAAYSFSKEIPLLESSALHYFPANVGYQHQSDSFHGVVKAERPLLGTRRPAKLSHIRQLLCSELGYHLGPFYLIEHSKGYIKISHLATKIMCASLYVESNNDTSFLYEVIVPTDKSTPTLDRYEDAQFATELWLTLHDFAANLTDKLDSSSVQSLGALAFNAKQPEQTLHIGVERFQDDCRTGFYLLQELALFEDLMPDILITLDPALSINDLDMSYTDLSDQALREACRRAVVLASDTPDTTLSSEIMMDAVTMQREIIALTNQP